MLPCDMGALLLIEYIPLQQGLRPFVFLFSTHSYLIEYIPLQQGLRLSVFVFHSFILSHWVYSITTRIKTSLPQFRTPVLSHWVYSITTRIKTIPLSASCQHSKTHWVYSITTRIKTTATRPSGSMITLIEYIPLQQGLRHLHHFKWATSWLIEYIPLQQGLRLRYLQYSSLYLPNSLSIFHYNKD